MSSNPDIAYALDFYIGKKGKRADATQSSDRELPDAENTGRGIPRIARLMALAIRFEDLLRKEEIRNYAELARLGRVSRTRMTQIMKLRYLAPDIREQVLFLPPIKGLNERSLRLVVSRIDWREQRRLFAELRFLLPPATKESGL